MDKGTIQVRAYLRRHANITDIDNIQDWYMRAESQRLGGGQGHTDDKKFIETDTMIMNMNTVSQDSYSDEFMDKITRGRFDL